MIAAWPRYQGLNELLLDWEQLKQLYLQKSAGPAKLEVLSGWLNAQLLQAAQRLWEDLQATVEERKTAMQQQLADSEARILQMKAPDDAQRRRLGAWACAPPWGQIQLLIC